MQLQIASNIYANLKITLKMRNCNAVSYFKKVFKILGKVDVTLFAILNQLKLCICSLHLDNLTEAEVHLSKSFEVCKQLSIF